MSQNLKKFTVEMGKMEQAIKDEIAGVTKDAVLYAYKNLLRPKDQGGAPKVSGWLRSLIFIALNTPETGIVGSQENVNTSKRDKLANNFQGASTQEMLNALTIYITLMAPYTTDVNDGNSRQRGQHFIERSVQDIGIGFRTRR